MKRPLECAMVAVFLAGLFFSGSCEDSLEVIVRKADLEKTANDIEGWYHRQGLVLHDSAALACIGQMIEKLGADDPATRRFHVLLVKSSTPNAMSFANGLLIVCTGIFVAVDNEMELAFLLAHEMAHYTLDHHTRERYEMHRRSVELLRGQIVGAIFIGGLATAYSDLSLQQAMCGFSRTFEDEADRKALNTLVKAGYDPRKAVRLFENLRTRTESDEKIKDTLLITHPRLSERIARAGKYLDSLRVQPGPAVNGDQRFPGTFSNVYLVNAGECLSASEFDKGLWCIRVCRGVTVPAADVAALQGSLFLMRRDSLDIDSAITCFKTAMTSDTGMMTVRRDLGYCYLLKKQDDSARRYLEGYLNGCPLAADSAFVRLYLRYLNEK